MNTSTQLPGLQSYLESRLGGQIDILKCRRSFPGASRETWLIWTEHDGRPAGYTLRVDPPIGRAVPFSLRTEYEVYAKLFRTEVPVAEPLWFDEGGDFLDGRPLMVRRLVDGATSIEGLTARTPEGAALRKKIAYEVIENLARLHLLDWQALGFGEIIPAPPAPAEALRFELDLWVDFWDRRRPGADPVVEEAICWLREQVPTDTPRISLLKGNNGVGEEIWRDNRIIAMSDWELASIGDGAGDIQFSEGTLSLHDVDDVIAHYGRCTGQEVSPQRLAFSAFLVWFKQYVCNRGYMYRSFTEDGDPRITSFTFGHLYSHGPRKRLADCIGRDIVEVWRELRADEKSIYTDYREHRS